MISLREDRPPIWAVSHESCDDDRRDCRRQRTEDRGQIYSLLCQRRLPGGQQCTVWNWELTHITATLERRTSSFAATIRLSSPGRAGVCLSSVLCFLSSAIAFDQRQSYSPQALCMIYPERIFEMRLPWHGHGQGRGGDGLRHTTDYR